MSQSDVKAVRCLELSESLPENEVLHEFTQPSIATTRRAQSHSMNRCCHPQNTSRTIYETSDPVKTNTLLNKLWQSGLRFERNGQRAIVAVDGRENRSIWNSPDRQHCQLRLRMFGARSLSGMPFLLFTSTKLSTRRQPTTRNMFGVHTSEHILLILRISLLRATITPESTHFHATPSSASTSSPSSSSTIITIVMLMADDDEQGYTLHANSTRTLHTLIPVSTSFTHICICILLECIHMQMQSRMIPLANAPHHRTFKHHIISMSHGRLPSIFEAT